jgi:hypothetical protein
VPHPANGVLYLKLRDDPETVQTLALSVLPVTNALASKPSESRQEQQSAQTPPQSKTEQ